MSPTHCCLSFLLIWPVCPTQLICISDVYLSLCQQTNTKDIARQSASQPRSSSVKSSRQSVQFSWLSSSSILQIEAIWWRGYQHAHWVCIIGHIYRIYRNAWNEIINLGMIGCAMFFGRLQHNGRGWQSGYLPAPGLTTSRVNTDTYAPGLTTFTVKFGYCLNSCLPWPRWANKYYYSLNIIFSQCF